MHEGFTKNEYGTPVSKHTCDVCGYKFTVCPARPAYENTPCQMTWCASYSAATDVDKMFEEGTAQLERGPIIKPS